ncbi:Fas-activated serine/threonine kinase [Operophtera brumata]|uniref:Fas-activated serine/threonine kinase n=1 Tax=Operophtera brumata TaxID=104452 RepID=A0A0L7LF44_OPEBR|nr:Fas-activated serine/threonine kinase [Operophtera brumata]
MSIVFRRYIKANSSLFLLGNATTPFHQTCLVRSFSDEKSITETQYSSSTILIENGLNVHELPLVVRRLKNITEVDEIHSTESPQSTTDSINYHMIQDEFKQCMDLRDVFSLLTKCTKITPNIALGAIERIYDLEKNPTLISIATRTMNINLAKGAIMEKLLRVIILKTEDTQTIINILNTDSSSMEPYKPKFSDEILLRVIDNRLSIEQLCEFMEFLIRNKSDPKYAETIDKLWVGFLEREQDIDEHNIRKVFQVLHGLKSSKKTILAVLEQKFSDLWFKINVPVMVDILDTFVQEKYISAQSFAVVGTWLYANIHAIDQDSLLDVISKLTQLNYTDDQVEKAVEKKLHLIDTALSLECSDYHGPLLPKDQWTQDVPQDPRIRNILQKTMDIFASVAGGPHKVSTAVMVPHIYSDYTYLVDVLIQPTGLVNNTFNWKSKSARNDNVAVLIHLPDHYCSDHQQLVGHQEMRKKHLKILGMKVATLKYTTLSQYYTSCNTGGLKKYLEDSLNKAEECTNI